MLNWICIAAGAILLLGGGAAWMALNRRSKPSHKSRQPPPLPQGRGSASRRAALRQPVGNRPRLAVPANVRPARREEPINHRNPRTARPSRSEPAVRRTLPAAGAGPRGIRPDQLPGAEPARAAPENFLE